MRNLYIIIVLCIQTSVRSHQYEADQVYVRLSNKVDYEMGILKRKHERELQDIRVEILSKIESQNEKIDSVRTKIFSEEILSEIESQINEKIDSKIESQIKEKMNSVQTEIFSSQPVHSEAIRNTQQNREVKTDHSENQRGTETQLEKIKDEVAIIKQAFKAEKKHVRALEDITASCTERINTMNDSILRNEERHTYIAENFKEGKDCLERQPKDPGATQGLLGENQDTLEQKVDKLKAKQSSLDTKVGNNQDSLNQLLNRMERRKVAFSAYLGASTEKLPIGSTVVFDSLIFQEGNGYNPKDGIFICPETGVYMFSVVIHNGNRQTVLGKAVALLVKLKVDSLSKALVISEQQHEGQDLQSSNFAILKVKQGQRVWVETYEQSDVVVWNLFSTFSGALLYN